MYGLAVMLSIPRLTTSKNIDEIKVYDTGYRSTKQYFLNAYIRISNLKADISKCCATQNKE